MSILDELRYPRHWYTKLLTMLLALLFFAVLATVVISGVLTYWIVKPQRTSTEISMASFPGISWRAHYYFVPRLRIQPRRTSHPGFRLAGSPVQRVRFRFCRAR